MPIQISIFLTKSKIFACEIKNNGKAETISIKGNSEIKCEGKECVDELIACLFDAFNIDDFSDDNFDIVIVESSADRGVIKYLETKCAGAGKFNIFSMEKLLPVIVSNKNLIKITENITVSFAEEFYNISCDKNAVIKINVGKQDKKSILLNQDDFAIIFNFRLVENKKENEKTVFKYEKDIKKYKQTILDLNKKVNDLQKELQEAKKSLDTKMNKTNGARIQDKTAADLENDLKIILQKHKTIFESTPEYEGEFYISGTMPLTKLPLDVRADVRDYYGDEAILAIYCLTNCKDDKILRYLIISYAGIQYSNDLSGEPGFVSWDDIRNIENEIVFNNIYISLDLTNGRRIRFGGIDKSLKTRKTTQKFLLNLLTEFKKLKLY